MNNDEYKAKLSKLVDAYGHRQAMTAKAWLTGRVPSARCKEWRENEWQQFIVLVERLEAKLKEAGNDG